MPIETFDDRRIFLDKMREARKPEALEKKKKFLNSIAEIVTDPIFNVIMDIINKKSCLWTTISTYSVKMC